MTIVTERDPSQSGTAYARLESDKHRRFVDEYLIDHNGAAAAKRAGYSERRAKQTAHELLERPDIKAAIEEKQAVLRNKNEVAAQAVVDELAKLAFGNIFDFVRVDNDGKPYTDFSGLTREQAAAITELTVETIPAVRGEDGGEVTPEVTKVRFKLADKRGPLVDLGRHLGLFDEYQNGGKGAEGRDGGQSARELVEGRLARLAARSGT